MRFLYLAALLLPLGAGPLLHAHTAHAESVTITARRMLDVDTGQIVADPLIQIEGGVITQVRKRNG